MDAGAVKGLETAEQLVARGHAPSLLSDAQASTTQLLPVGAVQRL